MDRRQSLMLIMELSDQRREMKAVRMSRKDGGWDEWGGGVKR